MSALYKELQPADVYTIRLPYPFSNYDRQLLTLLYQPMIGAEATAFYLTLWAEGERSNQQATHYNLMDILGLPIFKVFEARIQLEAIGLLKTFRKDGESRSFVYELCPPLDPKSFFQDPLLSMFLFSKISETAYRRVRDRFLMPQMDMTGYEEVSRTFTDIYQPVHAKAGYPAEQPDMQQRKRQGYEADFDFDFALLRQGLSEQLVPNRVLTAPIKQKVKQLAFLYGWGPLEMQTVLLMAIDENNQLSMESVKKAAADYYKLTVSSTAPKLMPIRKPEPEAEQKTEETPQNRQDALVVYLETVSPVEMLRDIGDGKEPLPADVQLATQLVVHHGMKEPVVNVLLHYVMLRTDQKLTKSYVEKIASHWIRKKVTTAAEAMELARIEHDQYVKWKTEGPAAPFKSSASSNRKPVREEKLPEWFNKKEETPAAKAPRNESLEVEKQKLLAKLALKKGKVD